MKTYCNCTKRDYVYRGLHDEPVTFLYTELWVCATCCLPTRLVWEGLVRTCQGCLRQTALPWETICYNCFKLEHPNEPYKGLLAAAKRAKKICQWPVGKTLAKTEMKFDDVFLDVTLQDKASEPPRSQNLISGFEKLSDTI